MVQTRRARADETRFACKERARRPLRSACRRPLRALGFAASLPACAPRSPRPLARGAALCAVLRRSRPHPARPRCACCLPLSVCAFSFATPPALACRGEGAPAPEWAQKSGAPRCPLWCALLRIYTKHIILYNCPRSLAHPLASRAQLVARRKAAAPVHWSPVVWSARRVVVAFRRATKLNVPLVLCNCVVCVLFRACAFRCCAPPFPSFSFLLFLRARAAAPRRGRANARLSAR